MITLVKANYNYDSYLDISDTYFVDDDVIQNEFVFAVDKNLSDEGVNDNIFAKIYNDAYYYVEEVAWMLDGYDDNTYEDTIGYIEDQYECDTTTAHRIADLIRSDDSEDDTFYCKLFSIVSGKTYTCKDFQNYPNYFLTLFYPTDEESIANEIGEIWVGNYLEVDVAELSDEEAAQLNLPEDLQNINIFEYDIYSTIVPDEYMWSKAELCKYLEFDEAKTYVCLDDSNNWQ